MKEFKIGHSVKEHKGYYELSREMSRTRYTGRKFKTKFENCGTWE